MADLFSVRAPLVVRLPDGSHHLCVAIFPHPAGLVYCQPVWEKEEVTARTHLLVGEIKGGGPWRVGDAVVRLLGCHGTDPGLASEYAEWQAWCHEQGRGCCPMREQLEQAARALGAEL